MFITVFDGLFDFNAPNPHAKWSLDKNKLMALILVGQPIPAVLSKQSTSGQQMQSLLRTLNSPGFKNHSYPSYGQYEYLVDMLNDCNSSCTDAKLCLYWTKAERDAGKNSWKPLYFNSNEKAKHYTYAEYYAKIPWLIRRKVIRLEKLSDYQVMQRVSKLVTSLC
jgi:hypothetical protein